MKKTLLLILLTSVSLQAMDTTGSDTSDSFSQDASIEQLCLAVGAYYFDKDHVELRSIVMKQLSIQMRRSSRRLTIENIFFGDDVSASPIPFDVETNDSQETIQTKNTIHRMVLDAVEDSFKEKDQQIDGYRGDITNNRLKFRLAMIAAITTGLTTITSTVATLILALLK